MSQKWYNIESFDFIMVFIGIIMLKNRKDKPQAIYRYAQLKLVSRSIVGGPYTRSDVVLISTLCHAPFPQVSYVSQYIGLSACWNYVTVPISHASTAPNPPSTARSLKAVQSYVKCWYPSSKTYLIPNPNPYTLTTNINPYN